MWNVEKDTNGLNTRQETKSNLTNLWLLRDKAGRDKLGDCDQCIHTNDERTCQKPDLKEDLASGSLRTRLDHSELLGGGSFITVKKDRQRF